MLSNIALPPWKSALCSFKVGLQVGGEDVSLSLLSVPY